MLQEMLYSAACRLCAWLTLKYWESPYLFLEFVNVFLGKYMYVPVLFPLEENAKWTSIE